MSAWVVLAPTAAGRYDGIGDYSARLATALGAFEQTTVCVIGESALPSPGEVDVVWHQYSPAALGGDAARATDRWLRDVTRAGGRVIVTVHEYWPPANGTLRRALFRASLRRRVRRAIGRSAAVVVAQDISKRNLADAGILGDRPVAVIPVGSNIEAFAGPAPVRDGGLVLFGQPAAMDPVALRALARWRSGRTHAMPLTWIGRSADEILACWVESAGGRAEDIRCLGAVSESTVAEHLARATAGLAPYADGASTRRTTLAALLQHGVPTVALSGIATDDWLRRHTGVAWVPAAPPDRFVSMIETILNDDRRREELSGHARALFEAHMSWTAIGNGYRQLWQAVKGHQA